MSPYLLRYAAWTGRADETLDASEVRREGRWLVLERWELVVGRPRCVVALRVGADEVEWVTAVGSPVAPA